MNKHCKPAWCSARESRVIEISSVIESPLRCNIFDTFLANYYSQVILDCERS